MGLPRYSKTIDKPVIRSIEQVGDLESATRRLDLLIFPLGYETRSTYLAQKFLWSPEKAVALRFARPDIHAYATNCQWVADQKIRTIDWKAEGYRQQLESVIAASANDVNNVRPVAIGVDISSMTRDMMAEVWAALLSSSVPTNCTFFYSCAKFGGVPAHFPPITVNEPISALFSAWPIKPQLPIELIVGLGYERGRAAAAIESFEAQDVTFFSPEGGPAEYLGQLGIVNKSVLSGRAASIVRYDLMNMYDIIARLSQLVSQSVVDARSVIVPFGPKTFALAAMVVSISFPHRVSVWRLSGGADDPTPDRLPTGEIAAIVISLAGAKT